MNTMKKIASIWLIVFAFLAIAPVAFAYDFSPIIAQFAPKGPGAVRSFSVRNTQPNPVALQIEVVRRTAGPNGEEIQEPELDDFLITPPQLVLAIGASQNIRAQWLGDPNPKKELAYRFIVTQVPIKFQKISENREMRATMQFGYRYEAAIYVTPPGAKPEAHVASAQAATNAKGERVLKVMVESTGTMRAILVEPELVVEAGGRSLTLKGEQLPGVNMKNILCGTQMMFELPWPKELPDGPVKASLRTKYLML